jgi:hypothetical protein
MTGNGENPPNRTINNKKKGKSQGSHIGT